MNVGQLCLAHLIHNENYMRKVIPYIEDKYFETPGAKEIFKLIKKYISDYNSRPTMEALAIILQDTVMGEKIFDDAVGTLAAISQSYDSATNTDWVVDTTEQWVKDREIFEALNECVQIADGALKDKTKENIPDIMMKALGVSFDSYLGLKYFDDESYDRQFDYMHAEETRIPFGIKIMNIATKGGVAKKTLNIVMAGINVGKTTFLIDRAAEMLEQGKNVVYFTLEVAEEVIRERTDVRMCDITFDKLHSLDRHQYKNRLKKLQEKSDGQLFIKEYPAGMAHVGHFRHFIQELYIKHGIKPDMIIVDYLGEASSALLPPSAMQNTNIYYTSIAREFRALGTEFNVPLWTAMQFNRDGQKSNTVDMTNVADAIGIPKVADFMCAFVQPEEMAEKDQAIGIIMKNRYANKAKMRKFVIGVDNDRQRFFDVDMNAQQGVMNQDELEMVSKMTGPKPGAANDRSAWNMASV